MNWKQILLVTLVIVLVLVGFPMLMGTGGTACAECGPAVAAGQNCALAGVVAGLGLALALLEQRLRTQRLYLLELLRANPFDRPPQLT